MATKKIKIYGYWHNKQLPEFLNNSINKTLSNNTYLEYEIFDEQLAKDFLKLNFPKEVLDSYNILKPYAYKSDLIRYCLLYINGGIYIDLKLILNPIEKVFFTNNEYHFAIYNRTKLPNIENSFLYFKKPKSPYLLKAINKIVENVQNRDKTINCLLITGPKLLFNCLIDLKPTLQFDSRKKPISKFIYKYNKYNIIDNELTNYYHGKRRHQRYWLMWKKNDIFN